MEIFLVTAALEIKRKEKQEQIMQKIIKIAEKYIF